MRPRPRFSGGRFWVLEPDEGKPSSPVLRGLCASNGARLLDNIGTGPDAKINFGGFRVYRDILKKTGGRAAITHTLFMTQRHHGVDPHPTSGWYPRRNKHDAGQHEGG